METKSETHKRSMTKSLLWRVMGVVILALITYIFTRSLIQTGMITFLHHFAFIGIYYGHERIWLKIAKKASHSNPTLVFLDRKKKWFRPFTYEIILGHCVLGVISLLVTGSWTQVGLITITYIENKLWIYFVYDRAWNKIHWGSIE